MHVDKIRLFLLCIAWSTAIINVIFGQSALALANAGVLSMLFFFVLTFSRLKKESITIITILVVVAFFLLDQFPSFEEFLSAGRFTLVFAALLPTMTLVRSVSSKVKSVKNSQDLLRNLPASISTSGFQIASHFFGSVINTGTFSILSAALPENSDKNYRKTIAEACLRGMNTSATWSPFFVAFAVGQEFIDTTNSWIAMACGILVGILFNFVSLPVFAYGSTLNKIKYSLACLSPVFPLLTLIMLSVLSVSVFFDFTALSAVVLVMPMLIVIYLLFNLKNFYEIYSNTKSWLLNSSDDITVICIAMLVGYLISRSNSINDYILLLESAFFPSWSLLALTPLIITVFSFMGIHPVITSTIALSLLTTAKTDIHPALLMQAHLVGWAAGTMSSVASLSVSTCSNLFQVESRKLAFGPNLLTAVIFSLSSGVFLSLVNSLIN
ncbi:MAG: hypothetical protein QGI65_05565 [SAR324 cluster bacterium]|jgi:hypothetical protein|nr:hypothetical protein [SAR324 cluster bacterium]|tara:strand:- start:1430 stop:2749 length:1320 start_codon:yes stop_codon:yes gene_type:complete